MIIDIFFNTVEATQIFDSALESSKVMGLNKKVSPFELNEKEISFIKTANLKKFVIKYPDKSLYKGYLNANWEREGFGVFHLQDGSVYEGFFRQNMMDGGGLINNAEGFLYDGDFLNNNGFGKYISLNGITYISHWKDEKKHGFG